MGEYGHAFGIVGNPLMNLDQWGIQFIFTKIPRVGAHISFKCLIIFTFLKAFNKSNTNTHTYKVPFFCCFFLSLVQNRDDNKGRSIVGGNMEFLTRSQRCI